jgi:simple sugar transport system permease protein
MSTTATSPVPGKPQQGKPQPGTPESAREKAPAISAKPVTWKVPVLLAVLGVVAFIFFGIMGPNQTAKFGISSSGDFFQLPAIEVPAFLGGIVLSVLMLGLAGYAVYLKTRNEASPGWLPIVFIVLFVAAFLI